MVAWKKYAKKGFRNVGRLAKKRYTVKGRGFGSYAGRKLNFSAIGKDVAMLKAMVNAEKKRVITSTVSGVIGQVDFNAPGGMCHDLTPSISQGTGYSSRIGNSVKIHSMFIQCQLQSQSAQLTQNTLVIQIFKVIGQPYVSGTNATFGFSNNSNPLNHIFLSDPFSGVRTLISPRDPDYFKRFRVLRTIRRTIKADSTGSESTIKTIGIPLKFKNYHLKYSQDTSTLTEGQLLMVAFLENGNSSTSSSSAVSNAPVTAINTGYKFLYTTTHYFYDN
jgi:hypothetical protein